MTQWGKRRPAFGEENLGLHGGGSVTAGGFKGPGLGRGRGRGRGELQK